MTNQLGGWSVSWQGVFGAGPRLLHRPARPDPARHDGAGGHPGRRPRHVTFTRRTRPRRSAQARLAPTRCVVVVGEKAYAEGLGDNPRPRLPPTSRR